MRCEEILPVWLGRLDGGLVWFECPNERFGIGFWTILALANGSGTAHQHCYNEVGTVNQRRAIRKISDPLQLRTFHEDLSWANASTVRFVLPFRSHRDKTPGRNAQLGTGAR